MDSDDSGRYHYWHWNYTLEVQLRIAYIAAGAAGMYCGTCIHDIMIGKDMIHHETNTQMTIPPSLRG